MFANMNCYIKIHYIIFIIILLKNKTAFLKLNFKIILFISFIDGLLKKYIIFSTIYKQSKIHVKKRMHIFLDNYKQDYKETML
jgi:hypothetical protein